MHPDRDPAHTLEELHEATDDARSRIVETATRLFSTRGFAGTSVREITQAAGVTNPTLYYHFGSKAGLFEAILAESVHTLDERLHAVLSTTCDFRTVLVEFLAAHFEVARDNPDLCRMYLECVMVRGRDRQAAAEVNGFDGARHERLGAILVEGQARGAIALGDIGPARIVFAGLVLVPILQYLDGHLDVLDRQTAERLIDLFLLGASPRPVLSPTVATVSPDTGDVS